MKTSTAEPAIQSVTLYSTPSLGPLPGRRLGYALSENGQITRQRPEGVDLIQRTLVTVNVCITGISLIFAIHCTAKMLLLSTVALAALASVMGIFIMNYSKKAKSTVEICVMALCSVYITFFTIIAAGVSLISVITG